MSMNEVELLKKALLREKAARKEAERILEQKALELYYINKQLAETNALLEKRVQERTEELNENASRLSALIGNLQSAVLVEDETRHIILVNNRFCELFGIPAPPEALKGMDCSTSAEQSKHLFTNPEQFMHRINETLANKKAVLAEPLQMCDGKKLERDYIPIYLDDNYVGHLWNYIDVTERTRLTEELEFVARFPEENPSPIMRFDVNSKLLYQNSAAKELISQFSVENLEVIQTAIGQTLYSNEKYKIELQLGNHYYTVNITPFIDKKYVNLYFNDVTERKRFQVELDNQKKFYEAILNRIPTDIAVFDNKHRYLFINPVAVRDQHTREWLIGKDDFDYCAYRNKDVELAKTRRAKFIKAVSNKEGMEWEDKVKDAQQNEAYIYRRMFPVFNETDELQFVIGFGIDITKVKQAEMKAEESLKAKEIFLANMSHEIRTPINGIIGLSGLLHKTALDSNQKNYLQLIKKSADNLLFIINDILDLAKVESGKIEIEIRPFELNDICNSVIQSMQYKAEEKEIQLLYSPFSFEPKYLNGDPFRLTQILTNLLNNAIKFTNTGAVELFVSTIEETEHTLTVQFRVEDTGIGIGPDKLHLIFDEFTQADKTTNRIYGGTGLGLSICKKLVELQGGRIWAESNPLKGSTFIFELSFVKTDKADLILKQPNIIDKTIIKPIKVLLAEDNEINQFIAQSMLQEWGFEVHVANNGFDAVNQVKKLVFDVILMDVQMPEMNGVEATKKIRAFEAKTKVHTPILALTANALKGDRERYIDAGMDDYLSKPFEEDELYYKIAHLLNIPIRYSEEPVKAVTNENNASYYSLHKLNAIAKGDEAFITKMLQLFLETTPELLQQLLQAFDNNQWEELNAAAHKLKPTIQTMDIKAIEADVKQLEKLALGNPNPTIIKPLLHKIITVLEQTMVQVKKDLLHNNT